MNDRRKPISLLKPDDKIDNTEYDNNGYKIMTPSHNVTDAEIYPEYHAPVESKLQPIAKSVQQHGKEYLNVSGSEMTDKPTAPSKVQIANKITVSYPAKPEKSSHDINGPAFQSSSQLPPVYDENNDLLAKLLILLHILFLLFYIIPVYAKPNDESAALTFIVAALLLCALSCIFILLKSHETKKILLSVLRVLTLAQFGMSTIAAVMGYILFNI